MAKQGLKKEYLAAIRRQLIAVMERDGLTQAGVQKAIGITQSHVSLIVSGKEVGLGAVGLIRLADYLGLGLDELLGRKVPPPVMLGRHPEAGTKSTQAAAVRKATGSKRKLPPETETEELLRELELEQERARK